MSEICDQYRKTLDLISERDRDRLTKAKRWGSFERYCWDRFLPQTCISVLCNDEEFIRGHKRIVLAGLCAWMAAPTDKRFLHGKDAVAIEVGSVYSEIEREVLTNAAGNHGMAALAIIFGGAAPLFVSHLYYPIGGLTALLESSSKNDFSVAHLELAAGMRSIARLVAIYHYIVQRRLEGLNLLSPSKLRAGKLFKSLKIGAPHWPLDGKDWPKAIEHERTVARHNQQFLPATALIYAASRLRYAPNVTLLSAIINNSVRFEMMREKLPLWLSMASFTQHHILSQASDRSYRRSDNFFDGVVPKEFPHPINNQKDCELIEKTFTKKSSKTS